MSAVHDIYSMLQKIRPINSADTSFGSRVPTVTQPSGTGVFAIGQNLGPQRLKLIPYGVGDDNDVFAMRIIGWSRTVEAPTIWIPCVIGELTCTMGGIVGVAGASIVDTERFCDTIAVVSQGKTSDTDGGGAAASSGQIELFSNANDLVAFAVIAVNGYQMVELTFDMTTGNPTNANCLIAPL